MVAMVMMVLMMSAPPALAHHDVGNFNRGNQPNDGPDANKGGGQEAPRNAHPDKGGGDCHGGGTETGGGCEDGQPGLHMGHVKIRGTR
jgi:hypothetical protein